ncbi:hypothetical protein JOD57_001295 [Geodermatophilus bullaregiensis]|nr:hypothetical protein [Geodermatophilus bullaregiensis]
MVPHGPGRSGEARPGASREAGHTDRLAARGRDRHGPNRRTGVGG